MMKLSDENEERKKKTTNLGIGEEKNIIGALRKNRKSDIDAVDREINFQLLKNKEETNLVRR